MVASAETLSPIPEAELSLTQRELQDIRLETDITKQLLALNPNFPHDVYCKIKADLPAADIEALVDFAADPEASSSLFVRAQAFELAAKALTNQWSPYYDELQPLRKKLNDCVPAQLAGRAALVRNPLDETANSALGTRWLTTRSLHSETTAEFKPITYRSMATALLEKEGIPYELVYPDLSEWHSDYKYSIDDAVPASALLFLEGMSTQIGAFDRGKKPLGLSMFTKLIPLAIEIQEATKSEVVLADTSDTIEITREAEEIKNFLELDKQKIEPYVSALAELKQSTRMLFIPFYSEALTSEIVYSANALFADCLYAVRAHIQNNNETDAEIPLNGSTSTGLPIRLSGNEPLDLIKQLNHGINTICELTGARKNVSKAVINPGFHIYRFWDHHFKSSPLSVYIRKQGAETYNSALEYGRNGEGVEASVSFVVDTSLGEGRLIELGKHRRAGTDNRISIRLDREGVKPEERGKPGVQRDPTQEQGTLSLDIGSVIGDENWLGTKIGRFLALGNVLRTAATGEESQLNHTTKYFSPTFGTSEEFAWQALLIQTEIEVQSVSKKELLERLSGRAAITGLQRGE